MSNTITNKETRFEYDSNDNPIFIGEGLPGSREGDGVWLIRKISYTLSGNVEKIEFAGSKDDYDQVWDNRTDYFE